MRPSGPSPDQRVLANVLLTNTMRSEVRLSALVKSLPAQDLDCEEVRAGQYREVRLNELLPPRALASFRCRCDTMPLQDVPHRLVGDRIGASHFTPYAGF